MFPKLIGGVVWYCQTYNHERNFGGMLIDCQTAKFNSLPDVPAMWYLAKNAIDTHCTQNFLDWNQVSVGSLVFS